MDMFKISWRVLAIEGRCVQDFEEKWSGLFLKCRQWWQIQQHWCFLSHVRARCDVIQWLKCQKWAQADGARGLMQWLWAMQPVLLSWPCRLTASQLRPPEGFCFLKLRPTPCLSRQKILLPPPRRRHMAGRQRYRKNFKEQTASNPPTHAWK